MLPSHAESPGFAGPSFRIAKAKDHSRGEYTKVVTKPGINRENEVIQDRMN